MARDRMLSFILSTPAVVTLICLGSIPFVFPLMSKYEGEVLPVVENIRVEEVRNDEDGTVIDVHFDKVRSCEFIGISWYDSFGTRVNVQFDIKGKNYTPFSRPVMNNQNAGPWKLMGLHNLDGSVAVTSHRCHPLWITYTHFYP